MRVPDFTKITARVVLVAIGQAFYATGVGMAMMIAYGAYVPAGASLVRSALSISGSIVLVSLLATVLVFPLVYRYGLDPAQGPDLVFKVLPVIFAEMPAGRVVGTLRIDPGEAPVLDITALLVSAGHRRRARDGPAIPVSHRV